MSKSEKNNWVAFETKMVAIELLGMSKHPDACVEYRNFHPWGHAGLERRGYIYLYGRNGSCDYYKLTAKGLAVGERLLRLRATVDA